MTIKNALISVSDKSNLEVLADYLIQNKVRAVSTGGTYKALVDLGVKAIKVSEQTDFPEVMAGRVKTLHPKIHMGLLARGSNEEDALVLKENGIDKFDLLVVNLYPFIEKLKDESLSQDQMVEFIDVGGPSMIRAGAKNFNRLLTLTDPSDYKILEGDIDLVLRKSMAQKAFRHLSDYDNSVSNWLLGEKPKSLRYGENPHQQASWTATEKVGLHQAKILQGKELSFNNIVDLSSAIETLAQFDANTVVSVKHNNPCGVATSDDVSTAVKKSLAGDPQSVFGGIVAMNSEIDLESAKQLTSLFLECVIAPSISKEAEELFKKKKNLRLLIWPELKNGFQPEKDFKRVSGGLVEQTADQSKLIDTKNWRVVSGDQTLDDELLKTLKFSWRCCQRLKSNAIAITGLEQSLGLGMGQVNRIDALNMAVERWKRHHSDYNGITVLASDAFFPFADSIEAAKEAGVDWIIQPGGSIKDQEVIDKAKELKINMVFTGKRHFLH